MQYIPESNRKNVNNLTLSKNNDMENNSINNQANINNNNNFNNKICLSEINNNNNLFNNMNNINNNNFNRINQMYFGNNQIYFGNNQMQNFIGINPNMNSTLIRLNMEFKLCCKDECLATIVSNFRLPSNDLYTWEVNMLGPRNSPYEGGNFRIKISFPKDFPTHGPEFKILNKIYHLNVDPKNDIGHISMNNLNEWRSTGKVTSFPGYNVKKALFDIFYLISYGGDTLSPYDDEMAVQLRDNPKEFYKKAKEWTKLFAS